MRRLTKTEARHHAASNGSAVVVDTEIVDDSEAVGTDLLAEEARTQPPENRVVIVVPNLS